MKLTIHTVRWGVAGVFTVVLLFIYSRYNPATTSFFLRCPFKMLTGYDCPGCGSQRAVHYLLHLKMNSAVHANALFVFALPYVLLLLLADRFQTRSRVLSFCYNTLFHPKAIWAVFVLVVSWWIVRNV